MSGRSDYLNELIQHGLTDQAIVWVKDVDDYREGEEFVFVVLRAEKSAPELVDAVLERFLSMRQNRYRQHGYWVHSLSHFTKHIWERKMFDWIKRFNEVAFKGANELGDSNCCERLVCDFTKYAPFDFNPADFHLTMANLPWMKWDKYYLLEKARIEHGPFESADDLTRCEMLTEMRNPRTFERSDFESQSSLVNVEGISERRKKLQALGVDISEFDGLERRLLEAKLVELDARLASFSKNDWPEDTKEEWRGRTRKGIAVTKAALVALQV